jgi:hypothetical protein
VTDSDLSVTPVVSLDGNEAVAGANQFNDPPPSGMRYILVHLTFLNGTDEPVTPWVAVDVGAIGSQNAVHSSNDCGAVTPEALFDAPEIYPGGTAAGNVCVLVPEVEIADGSLLIMIGPSFGEPVFLRP